MNAIEINVPGLAGLEAAWRQAPAIVRQELAAAMTEADTLLEREVKERTPDGASAGGAAGLKGSIIGVETVGADNVIGVVGSALNYAEPVELGTRPHFPPVDALIDWVRVKFPEAKSESAARGIAFAIARNISKRGTKGKHMFKRAFEANRGEVDRIFARANERIAERLAGGA